jgi:hypothetical protein
VGAGDQRDHCVAPFVRPENSTDQGRFMDASRKQTAVIAIALLAAPVSV